MLPASVLLTSHSVLMQCVCNVALLRPQEALGPALVGILNSMLQNSSAEGPSR